VQPSAHTRCYWPMNAQNFVAFKVRVSAACARVYLCVCVLAQLYTHACKNTHTFKHTPLSSFPWHFSQSASVPQLKHTNTHTHAHAHTQTHTRTRQLPLPLFTVCECASAQTYKHTHARAAHTQTHTHAHTYTCIYTFRQLSLPLVTARFDAASADTASTLPLCPAQFQAKITHQFCKEGQWGKFQQRRYNLTVPRPR
jgi:hypothetical protein